MICDRIVDERILEKGREGNSKLNERRSVRRSQDEGNRVHAFCKKRWGEKKAREKSRWWHRLKVRREKGIIWPGAHQVISSLEK